VKAQSAVSREARDEAARLRASGAALRQAADISGAELRPLLDAIAGEASSDVRKARTLLVKHAGGTPH